jgi:hypothetical protein
LSFSLSLKFFLQQNPRRGQNRFCLEAGRERGGGTNSVYTKQVNVKMIKGKKFLKKKLS